MKISPFLAFVLSVSIVSSLPAQTAPRNQAPKGPPVDDEVVRVSTNLVQIDAVVTDINGKLVTDLRAEDFTILEDNRPQKISAFSYVSTESSVLATSSAPPAHGVKNAPPLPPAPLRPEQVRRTIVFVIDDLGLSFPSFTAVQAGLKTFVDQQMQPGDLAAIIRTGGGAGALHRLTTDKRQMYAAIDQAQWRGGFGNRVGLHTFISKNEIPMFRAETAEARISLKGTLMALENITRALRVLPGRKSILFFTDNLNFRHDAADVQVEDGAPASPGSLTRSSDFGASRNDRIRETNPIAGLLQASNQSSVVIYTVCAFGLANTSPTAADRSPSGNLISGDPITQLTSGKWMTDTLDARSNQVRQTQEGLQELAHETGGLAIINNNDLGKGIGRIMEDLKGYYLIGYRPSDSTFEKRNGRTPYHEITIKLNRPDLHIRSRQGFYGVPDVKLPQITPHSKEEQLVTALESPFSAGGIRLRLTTLFGNVPQGSFLRTLLHIDARDLTFEKQPGGWYQAKFDVIASSYGENGLIADNLSRAEIIRTRETMYAKLLRYGLNYNLLVPIKKPGPYQLRAAVRDLASERIGSAYQFAEVPELKRGRLALSGIVLSAKILDLAALSANSGVYDAPSGNGEQAQPTPAVRRFKAGTLLDYGYFIYNAHLGKDNALPDFLAKIRLFHDGALLSSQEESPLDTARLQLDPKRLSAKGHLRLVADFMPGQYVLQIVVTDPRAKEKYATVSQWIDFEVVK
ncbi:MAG: VWA domain-containing protein [Acidobacteriota bacterium]|nr:VWA domain-containing protein [Acidobacteriota bacterium]